MLKKLSLTSRSWTWILLISSISSVACQNQNVTNNTSYNYGRIQIIDSQNQSPEEICMSYPGKLYDLGTDPGEATPYSIQDLSAFDLCFNDTIPYKPSSAPNSLVLLSASQCSIRNRLEFFEEKKALGIIVISSYRYNIYQNYSLDVFAVVSPQHASLLKKQNIQVKLTDFNVEKQKSFDWSLVVLWFIAVFCVFMGGLTGPYQLIPTPARTPKTSETENLEQPEPKASTPQRAASLETVTVPVAIILVVFISTTLMLLYFFYQYLVYFFMAIFCIASARAVFFILSQIWNYLVKVEFRRYWMFTIPEAIFLLSGIALAIVWSIFRHSSWVWILQDILGLCFCIHFIQILHLPNMKVITILLSLLFVYDIFFVFVTPYITKDGKSVMVEVATGVSGSGSGESLPMLFKFPHLQLQAITLCIGQQYSLLGYGDVIVPGFLVCFAHVFDLRNNSSSICRPYFIAALIAYMIGLAGAFVALLLSSTGQPALLYIVPAVLLSIFSVGIYKKEIHHLWTGSRNIPIPHIEHYQEHVNA